MMNLISTTIENGVGRIKLNRPEKFNSFNRDMALQMQTALDQFSTDAAVRCIAIEADGNAFCAGQDLAEAIAPDGPGIQKIVDEKLVGAITVCEELTQMENGNYRSYVALELTGKEVLSALNTGLSQDQILKVDYDYEKFKAEFEKEMNKRAGGQ